MVCLLCARLSSKYWGVHSNKQMKSLPYAQTIFSIVGRETMTK